MGKIVTCTVDELALPVMGGYKSGTAVAAADGAEKELIKQFRLGIGLVEKVHIDAGQMGGIFFVLPCGFRNKRFHTDDDGLFIDCHSCLFTRTGMWSYRRQ